VTVQLVALAFDTGDPHELGRFWAHALEWDLREVNGVGVDLVPTDATAFRLSLRLGAGEKTGQNRIHFDLTTKSADEFASTIAGLLSVGAVHADVGQSGEEDHVVLADREGNEFCIISPENQFLASCPRLGAVNCDGTAGLGRFWSDALGWPLVWDHDEETAIQAPDGTGPKITWSGPPLMETFGRDRFHFHVSPSPGAALHDALDTLVSLGAVRVLGADTRHACPRAIELSDPDGNRFCLVEPPENITKP
jgi:catechol 2,3-dioxygenase-like lactoylglutathione lyase family enzyme